MADMMKYTGAINILRSDRILPRAWRLEIADMLETMEKHREISTLDDRVHVSSHSGDGVLHRSGSRSGDPGAGGGACDPVAAVRDDGHSAGPARTDGLIDRLDVKAEAKEAEADEEKELFAAVTKIDLAGAVKHLRNWTAYKADEHCQEYANLIEAQARLIAWFVKERASNNTSGDVKAEAKSQEPEAVAWIGLTADGDCRIWFRDKTRAEAFERNHNITLTPLYTHPTTKPEAPAVSVDAETIGAAARIIDPDAFKKYLYDAMLTSRRDRALTKATTIAALISGGR